MNQKIQTLRNGLIVSCQAPTDSPLHNPLIIAAIAQAAVNQGAVAVRIDTPAHVKAFRRQNPTTLIIGLWKQQLEGSEVYITPQFEHATAVASADADIIALDATQRQRPQGEKLEEIIAQIHSQGKLVMADVDTIENAIAAKQAGADLIATTLYGYTPQTKHLSPPGFELLTELVKLETPAICEGGIASPQMAQQALQLGAYAVVVGTAITGIDLQVKAYQQALAHLF
ncbi:MAG: N-acetylmannosamine-6-phosphate 2-epimerase [Coleofasciculaceae cyanobacterium]